MMQKPYPSEPGRAVFSFARSAKTWRADIEAYLVERELSIELADAVIGLVDFFGSSLEQAGDSLQQLLNWAATQAETQP